MQKFDPLAQNTPILGPHLLEASAGTGKTFSIEHVFVRLLLEKIEPPFDIEEILVVTFTRASTRELKERIHANLKKAISFLKSDEDPPWEYLRAFQKCKAALHRLMQADLGFDGCQIFTIHGFCSHVLRKHAFEAGMGFSFKDPDEEFGSMKKYQRACQRFLKEKSLQEILCLEQIAHLFKAYASRKDLEKALLQSHEKEGLNFSQSFAKFRKGVDFFLDSMDEAKLMADFFELTKNQKSSKKDFSKQVIALARSISDRENPIHFCTLIREKGSIFSFLSPENRKVKQLEVRCFYPGFFQEAERQFYEIIEEASNAQKIFKTLAFYWGKKKREIFSEEEWTSPDEILEKMREALTSSHLKKSISQNVRALIVDEFQDTDPLQWDIFKTLFLEPKIELEALYLVGDPKQSIYRFRKADIYTYFQAQNLLGDKACYSLDTNYRSSQKMVHALNALFETVSFSLPKLEKKLPYTPVLPGKMESTSFSDGKGSVHAVLAHKGKNLFESTYLPYAISEIEKLHGEGMALHSFALLVKDRYEAEKALGALKKRGLVAFAKSAQALGKTEAFLAFKELFMAILLADEASYARIVELGPFAPFQKIDPDLLLKEGLASFLLKVDVEKITYFEPSDVRQVIEELLYWERNHGFSKERFLRFLHELEAMGVDEGGRRRVDIPQDAVHILTLHISKGLEFDIVFALGLASEPPDPEEEEEEMYAEMQRQLYVAMTRAKKRLYFPAFVPSERLGRSPIERCFQGEDLLDRFTHLSQKEDFTFEIIESPFLLSSSFSEEILEQKKQCVKKVFRDNPSYLHSFTTLSQPKERREESATFQEDLSLFGMPRGKETGIVIHQIFQEIFSKRDCLLYNRERISQKIQDILQFSSLKPWQESIEKQVFQILETPLFGDSFCLKDLSSEHFFSEMEFLFEDSPHFIKGFIDLVFFYQGKYYLLDWKTNWLGSTFQDYSQENMEREMSLHDYWLQAKLYGEALTRHLSKFSEGSFGGAIYFFFRAATFLRV